jgi:protoporphyrin/coproporphyrin ferrochelatase
MRPKRAIVLLNMGGPNHLGEVKTFLTNMFNDHRIIGAPKPIRSLIAWLITTRRLKESTANYALLGGKSPIVDHTRHLVDAPLRRYRCGGALRDALHPPLYR